LHALSDTGEVIVYNKTDYHLRWLFPDALHQWGDEIIYPYKRIKLIFYQWPPIKVIFWTVKEDIGEEWAIIVVLNSDSMHQMYEIMITIDEQGEIIYEVK
jgi:hypothetical protein